jgi:hypothetical protein
VEGGRLSGEVANTGDADLRSVTVSVGEGCLSPARPVAFLGALPARSASPFSVELGQARACAPGELVSVAAAFGDGLGWEGQATGSALAQAQAPALPSLLPLLALVVALSLLVVARYVRGLRRVQRALAAERERLAELEGAQMPRRGG